MAIDGELLGALLRGIERDAKAVAREGYRPPVLFDSRGREVAFAEPPARRFSGEIATSVDDIFGTYWHPAGVQYNPDALAVKKGGLKIYHEMRLDDQAKAALHLKKSAIVYPGWKIVAEKDEGPKEFVENMLDRMEGTLESVAWSMLSAYDYGFSLHEKVYEYIEDGPFKGKIGVRAVKQKSPTRIEFRTDDYGNIQRNGIIQRQRSGELRHLPLERFILFTYQKEFDNYYGQSDLRAAYRFWFLKVNFFRYWGMYLERFGVPLALGKAESATLSSADQALFRQLVQNLQAGMSAVLPPGLEIEFKEAARTDRGTFQQAIDACDIRIARAVLLPTLLGLSAGQDKGSLARSKTEADTFDMILGGDTRALADVINEQWIRPMVEMNFGTVEDMPRLEFNPMREEDKQVLITAWTDAVSKKAATSSLETERHVRSVLGFPEMTPEEEKTLEERREAAEAATQALVAAGGVPGKKGNGRGNGKADEMDDDEKGKKVYVLTTMNPQEARKAWDDHLRDLEDLEDEARDALSSAFEKNIRSLVVEARKKD